MFESCSGLFVCSSAEDEGAEPGRVEEHPGAAALGGFPGLSGAAAEPTEQTELSSMDTGPT